MNKSAIVFTGFLVIVVAAILAISLVFGGLTSAQAYDIAIKIGAALLIVLIAAMAVMALMPKDGKK